MALDLATLSIVLFFISTIQAIVMLFIFRIVHNYPGMNYLLASCFFTALSGLVFALRSGVISEIPAILISNLSTFLAVSALNIGISKFLKLDIAKKWLFTLLVLFIITFFTFTLVIDDVSWRIILFSLLISWISFSNAFILLRHQLDSVRQTTRLAATVQIMFGIFFIVRGIFTFFHRTVNIFLPTPFQLLTFFISIATIIICSYCFIIMAIQRDHSEKKQADEQFRLIFETIPDTVLITSLETGEIHETNETFTEETGYSREEAIGKTPMNLNLWQNTDERDAFIEKMKEQGFCKNVEIHLFTKNRKKISVLISSNLMKMDHKMFIISVIRNISHNKELTKKLNTSEDTFKAIMEQSPVSFMLTNTNGDIEYVNKQFLELTGFLEEEVIGKNPRILKSGYQSKKFYGNLWKTITSGRQWKGEIRNRKKNGEIMWGYISLTPILDREGKIIRYLGVQEDISSRKRLEDELKIQARTDMLTGVMNRRYFIENAEKRLSEMNSIHEMAAFLMIDIDRFKDINDSFGHIMGDKAIQTVARQCQNMIKNRDLFGRIGGEEFGALIFAKNQDEYRKAADAIRYSVENINLSCEGEETIPLRISIGLSVYRPGEDTLETLMHRSDIALYQAKNDGRNRVAVL